jgi:hypothetical protein
LHPAPLWANNEPMRRLYAFLLILALLATPFAMAAGATYSARVSCPICGTRHVGAAACECPMHRKAQLPNAAFVSPLAPTAPASPANIAPPVAARASFVALTFSVTRGFFAPPFAPPRS